MTFGGEGSWALDIKPSFYIAKALEATFLSSNRNVRGRGEGGKSLMSEWR